MLKWSVFASAGHRGQQTLFDYVKRKKQSFNDGDDNASVGSSTTQGQTQQQGKFVMHFLEQAQLVPIWGDKHSHLLQLKMVCLAHQQPPSDIASGSNEKPVPPSQSTVQFPPLVGTKKRYFNPDWFKMYSWLEYSVEKDAAFCFPCRHFSTKSGRAEDTFTKKGFRNWKKATGKEGILIGHASCLTHIQAVSSWYEYKQNEEHGTSVASRLDSARNEHIRLNRHYLQSVAEVILLCSHLEIALWGHESNDSLNKDNFGEILQVVAKHDLVVEQRLEQRQRNATYLSPEIQNMLLHIMGDVLRKLISDSVWQAGFFSLLADESKDASMKEQLAIIVMYVDEKLSFMSDSLHYGGNKSDSWEFESIGWVLHLSYLRNMMELPSWVECTLEVEINIYRASSWQKKSQVNWMLLTQSITAK